MTFWTHVTSNIRPNELLHRSNYKVVPVSIQSCSLIASGNAGFLSDGQEDCLMPTESLHVCSGRCICAPGFPGTKTFMGESLATLGSSRPGLAPRHRNEEEEDTWMPRLSCPEPRPSPSVLLAIYDGLQWVGLRCSCHSLAANAP